MNIAFAESFTITLEGEAKHFRVIPWLFLYSPRKFRRAYSSTYRFVEEYISKRQFQKGIKYCESSGFVNYLAEEGVTTLGLRDQPVTRVVNSIYRNTPHK
jgi:hypothetical protein